MNYRKITFLFILVTSQVFSQIDEYSKSAFIYKLTHQSDSTDINSIRSENMLLLIGKEVSQFESYNKYKRDSLLSTIKNVPIQNFSISDIPTAPRTKIHYKILKNYPKDSITVYDNIFTDKFEYVELKKINWKIYADTLTINGYKSQKAVTSYGGRNYEAWFTTQIPIPDGPYKFCGLPGLIIKISDSKKHYVFEMTRISKNKFKMSNSFLFKKPLLTDKETFLKKLKESKDNAINRMAEMGFTVADESKQQVKRKMKALNNPIELSFD
tara:strand:- start:3191 stop:3997 length:807 start_codon:yes stop_codon:yes gene_type:complete